MIREKLKEKIKIEWIAALPPDEVDELIKEIAAIHARKYATSVVETALLENGHYVGSTNAIRVTRNK